jgi:ribonuclease P protein component
MSKTARKNQFTKAERLSSKKQINSLFCEGKSNWKGCLRINYLFSNEIQDVPVQVMFSVPKRQFRRAVDRNILKRRMREAYRLNKHDLYDKIKAENKYLLIALLYVGKNIEEYSKIESDIKELLAILLKSI